MKNIIYSSPKTSFVLRKIKINAAKRKIKNGVKSKKLKKQTIDLINDFRKTKTANLKITVRKSKTTLPIPSLVLVFTQTAA